MERTDCFSWKESSSRMPHPLQTLANFWYQNITESLLLFNYPHLQYAILTWCKVTATYLTHLKVLHNRSIRCICKIFRAAHIPMLDLYHSCKIFEINQIYEYDLGKFMYKIVHNCFPSFISSCYSYINERHNYPTRIATNNNLTTTSSKNI